MVNVRDRVWWGVRVHVQDRVLHRVRLCVWGRAWSSGWSNVRDNGRGVVWDAVRSR